jgi:hypothetical protein
LARVAVDVGAAVEVAEADVLVNVAAAVTVATAIAVDVGAWLLLLSESHAASVPSIVTKASRPTAARIQLRGSLNLQWLHTICLAELELNARL